MLSDGKHRPGSVKMGYYALRFLFCNIYHKEWAKEYLPTPKVAKTLPLVLAKEEVEDVLGVIPNFKHRTVIMFIYSTGARVPVEKALTLVLPPYARYARRRVTIPHTSKRPTLRTLSAIALPHTTLRAEPTFW